MSTIHGLVRPWGHDLPLQLGTILNLTIGEIGDSSLSSSWPDAATGGAASNKVTAPATTRRRQTSIQD